MATLKMSADSEIAQRIGEAVASGEPLFIDTGEAINALHIDNRPLLADPHDIWATYDPDRVLRAFEQASGILAGVDIDQLLADLRAQR